MEKAVFCWSGGKDSALALYQIQQSKGYEIIALLTTITRDYDRVSMHGVRRALIEEQAYSLGLPLCPVFISPSASNEEYESKMKSALTKFKQEGISLVAFGDIFLEELKKYREENLAQLGMRGIFPIWQRDTRELVQLFITLGFHAVITCVDTKVLDKKFLGRKLDQHFLPELPPNIDPCGENGEFHSFVYDGPIFRRRINYTPGEQVLRDSFYFCDLLPDDGVKTLRKEALSK